MPLQRIYPSLEFKQMLENIIGSKIYLRNSFDQNQVEIQQLLEQGQKNALLYLERNRLGQKLAMFDENKLYNTVIELGEFLKLDRVPRRIECFDISHISGKFVYGSMVVFIDGCPISKFYRLFKCPDQNNDFENHKAVMMRRLKRGLEYEEILKSGNSEQILKNKGWQLPDLIIVDGGKGQLSADYEVLCSLGLQNKVNMVSLAKQEEEIFTPNQTNLQELFEGYKIGKEGGLLTTGELKFLLLRISDEAHRFAIKNNRNARIKAIKQSELDKIEGIGEITKNKLLTKFGSLTNLVENLYDNPEIVYEVAGQKVVGLLKKYFGIY
jgi:excinuclease ABC subunit C